MLFTTRKSGEKPKALRNGFLIAFSALTLSGCMSATGDMRSEDNAVPVEAAATPEQSQQTDDEDVAGYRDPMVSAGGKAGSIPTQAAETGTTPQSANLAEVIMQPAQVNAYQASIYSSGAAAAPEGAVPGNGAAAPAITNLYSVGNEAMPAEGKAETTGSIPSGGRASDEEASLVPDRVPLPKSARMALVAEPTDSAAESAFSTAGGTTGQSPNNDLDKTLTLAALFAAKRKTPNRIENNPSNGDQKRVLNRNTAGAYQAASLGSAIPGAATESLYAPPDHSEAEEEQPDNGVTEVASLAGLARLSPNGLWLQTEKVNTGCFKPQLLTVLKSIEQHYGKPVIVTSGVRPVKQNRSKQSLHTSCEAADIQIAGVSRWELAEYLRSRPGRGGVGTYCHTESVHIDIGPERDWNWQCRSKQN
ncbi:DUF882 domain-containing protein [Rhizobium sp. ARZ01]|uniref:YcbK family protein n=1 Tax=Rhizobium sp. ARZ01 TaxID=2769313 RepID=UPI001781C5AC|nr:YcbK family protein [Rhizobium sp. ARZ01]MBD9372250.1 DUF882 domain-containing protein [Rhizobium sp. ARZ01]